MFFVRSNVLRSCLSSPIFRTYSISSSDPSLGLTEEQREFQEVAKNFAINELSAIAPKWDEEREFPVEALKALAELGFASIDTSDEHGGSGLSPLDAAIIFESLSLACVATSSFLVQQNVVSRLIDRFGTDNQKQKFIPTIASLDVFSGLALPQSNGKEFTSNIQITSDSSKLTLTGNQRIPAGTYCDQFLVCAAEQNNPTQIHCLIVDKNTDGIQVKESEPTLGWSCLSSSIVDFSNVKVSADNIIGADQIPNSVVQQVLNSVRVSLAACSIGGAQQSLEMARDHMMARKQFGSPLANFQALQFRMADMATNLTVARQMVRTAASKLSDESISEEERNLFSAMAKVNATDVSFQVCNEVLQLFGGYGYLKEYQPQRYLRDLRFNQLYAGTNETLRLEMVANILTTNAISL